MSHVLVTGGAGYIGSHTVLELLASGHTPIILDNFCNSHPKVVSRLQTIMGCQITSIRGDVRDRDCLQRVFSTYNFAAVIHFAGLKAVGESVAKPLLYYDTNIGSTLALLQAMAAADVKQLVFSSSATVYGNAAASPIPEDAPLRPTSPYGHTKQMIEQLLQELSASASGFQATALRYFNPVGAHPSGLIGEDPTGVPNNLMPHITQVAVGKHERLQVFGCDYATEDGTGVRDYIHVMDLARGHVAALQQTQPGFRAVNLGSGKGTSVLELVAAFESANGKRVPITITGRRPGDVATCFADVNLAKEQLGWKAELDLKAMCRDAWRWQSRNPDGYAAADSKPAA